MKALIATIFACATAVAGAQSIGPWYVGDMEDGSYAATFNDSDAIFGKYCYRSENTCIWLLAGTITCNAGEEYPVLINSPNGAATLRVACKPIKGKPRYIFLDPDLMDQAVEKDGQLGVAFPMQSGQFQVTRFNINRATSALASLALRMRSAQRPAPSAPPRGPRDLTL